MNIIYQNSIRYIICFLLFFITNCKKTQLTIKNYESKKLNISEKICLTANGILRVVEGTKLELNLDSTFIKTTCNTISKGKFTIINETLILNIDTIIYNNTTNLNPSLLNKEEYQIKKDKLYQYLFLKVKRKDGTSSLVKAIELLK